ncbi:hypothetical protein [Candidatus Williamhamiltonella defendens]|uniref:hypothetical protein n=1 Tax=Candidatus Williamhamiltonella defendens TaxID=138072 RepID=UPI001F239370|nr:hypothetical protein [Candidatus Hamiltonella defensa]
MPCYKIKYRNLNDFINIAILIEICKHEFYSRINKNVHLKQEKEERAIMKILISGATDFIRSILVSSFSNKFEIAVLGRDMEHLKRRFPQHYAVDWKGVKAESVMNYQIVINLCGENIADKRWTSEQKQKFYKAV